MKGAATSGILYFALELLAFCTFSISIFCGIITISRNSGSGRCFLLVVRMTKSILQSEKECYITGATENLDRHHCFQGSRRQLSEKYGCVVWLRHDVHMRLHDSDRELDLRIKRDCQSAFESKYDHDTFMRIFGRNYLL